MDDKNKRRDGKHVVGACTFIKKYDSIEENE